MWMGESGENIDDWIAQFVKTLEKNNIGWAFWPYKKMEKSSAVVSIIPPADWGKIVEFAKLPRGTRARGRTAEDPTRPRDDHPRFRRVAGERPPAKVSRKWGIFKSTRDELKVPLTRERKGDLGASLCKITSLRARRYPCSRTTWTRRHYPLQYKYHWLSRPSSFRHLPSWTTCCSRTRKRRSLMCP